MRKIIFLIPLISVLLSVMAGPCHANAYDQLEQAEILMNNRQYDQAEGIYMQILTDHAHDEVALEAQKQLVLLYIATDNQPMADEAFDQLIVSYSQNRDIANAVWQIGMKYSQEKKYDKAYEIHQCNVETFHDDMYAMWSQVELTYAHIGKRDDAAADAAADALLTVFSKQPTLPKEIWQVAKKYDEFERYDKAFELNQYNIEHYPYDVNAVFSQVEIIKYHFQHGDAGAVDEGVSNFFKVFSGQPTLSKGIYHIARRYDEYRRYDKALELHQYNVEHFPDDVHAIWSQAEIIFSYIRDGDDTRADAAVDNLLTVFATQPTLPTEIYNVAMRYNSVGKTEKALELHQYNVEHFSKDDKHTMWSQVEIVKAHIQDANGAAADAAFKKLVAAFSQQPTLPKEVYMIADEYSKAGRYDKADQLYQYILEDRPRGEDDMWVKTGMTKLNIALGNDSVAEAILDSLLADFSGHKDLPEAVFVIGEEYYYDAWEDVNEGRTEEAKADFAKTIPVWQRIITKMPGSNPTVTADAYYFTGYCYSRLGDYEKAIEYYQSIVEDYPDYRYAWHAQLRIARNYQRLQNAGVIPDSEAEPKIIQAYEAVVENYPDCRLVHQACWPLGWMNFQKGLWNEAATYLELYLSKRPDSSQTPNILYHLGLAYEQMGKLDMAGEIYRAFIVLADPDDWRIERVKDKVKELTE